MRSASWRFAFLLLLAASDFVVAAEPYRLAETVAEVKKQIASAKTPSRKFNREDYLRVVHGNVRHFQYFQETNGAIIDPFQHKEVQYSTASFAWAAAAVVASGSQTNLIDKASLALDLALQQVTRTPQGAAQSDSITLPAMLAYEHLRNLVTPARRQKWEQQLSSLSPDAAYHDQLIEERTHVQVWNAGAIAGEFIRQQAGFTGTQFVEKYLDEQVKKFTPDGLYQDPYFALPYEQLARQSLSILLHRNYSGPHRKVLEEHLERGAWTALLIQSSQGEIPTGDRGCQQQWNEAAACVSYEIMARLKQKQGDTNSAQAFKRAARLSLDSIMRYVRRSYDLNIAKNAMDPAAQIGYDGFSSHAHQNLLTASLLATAWLITDDSIPASVAPAELGGFVIVLPEFNKIVANAGGLYLQFQAPARTNYSSTGLVRIHRNGVETAIGPSDGAAAPQNPLAVGIAWREGNAWRSLASYTEEQDIRSSLSIKEKSPQKVVFELRYHIGGTAKSILETYELTPDRVRVTAEVEGDVSEIRARFPAFVFTGVRPTRITVDGSKATVALGRSQQTFAVESPTGVQLRRTGNIVTSRNGLLDTIEGDVKGKRVVYTLTPQVTP